MSTHTSIGAGPGRDGSNDSPGNADGRGNKTLGEHAAPEPGTAARTPPGTPTPETPADKPPSR